MRRAKRLPLENLQPVLFTPPASWERTQREGNATSEKQLLSWSEVFANDRAVEIEVGYGKGLFLLNEAQRRPEVNFFGIEIERKYQLFSATRIVKSNLPNVKLACADARVFLDQHVPDAAVHALHVYFPDPWWKTRHRKRRLFNEQFIAQCARVLIPTGRLHLATDVEDYFKVMRELVETQTSLRIVAIPEDPTPAHDLDYLTHFERKFRKEGRPIFRILYER